MWNVVYKELGMSPCKQIQIELQKFALNQQKTWKRGTGYTSQFNQEDVEFANFHREKLANILQCSAPSTRSVTDVVT